MIFKKNIKNAWIRYLIHAQIQASCLFAPHIASAVLTIMDGAIQVDTQESHRLLRSNTTTEDKHFVVRILLDESGVNT